MLFKSLLTAMLVFPLVAAPTLAADKDNLQGIWLPTSAELGGQPFPEEVRKSIQLEIKDDGYTATVGGMVDRGTVKLNASAKPPQMDITGVEGPNKGKTILAIYECQGDTLQVCYDLSGAARPTEFKSAANTLQFLVTYQRQKR